VCIYIYIYIYIYIQGWVKTEVALESWIRMCCYTATVTHYLNNIHESILYACSRCQQVQNTKTINAIVQTCPDALRKIVRNLRKLSPILYSPISPDVLIGRCIKTQDTMTSSLQGREHIRMTTRSSYLFAAELHKAINVKLQIILETRLA